ncbi:PTS system, beta-glucoside-specific, IIABC component [Limosilactobacillus coleohominis 101-4-CHN]|uniref:PTS system sucrose-specific EIIBCA component n=1 Tax=Limosilactobacillus coleohominis 101-4-CHN TaxID=575594 RepID=C7XXG8_9LACO|nr:beta-glucoside-specific PTS transporter subunit IIABC [Limosilactobacillus coleohominis]EEU29719.1 PTS system, beta-glucoside-specific, IIABC component [Limosilactobacillus coleohominis 101-4-CHN]
MANQKEIEQSVQQIYKAVGGDNNIKSLTHCITRLRFQLKDWNKVDDQTVKNIPGVLGVNRQNGQYQIIIGNQVTDYYNAITKLGHFASNGEVPADDNDDQKRGLFDRFADFISSCMAPLIPALVAGGLMKLILIVLTTLSWMSDKSQTYILLSAIGDAPFYFLPIELAYTSAKYFRVNQMLAVCTAGVLIYPTFTALVKAGHAVHMMGLPVTLATYSASVIPILMTVWAMKYIEHWIDAITPNQIKSIVKPLAELFIMGVLALVIIGPIGTYLGRLLSMIMIFLNTKVGWLAMALMASLMPLIVMTGMHWAFAPIFLAASVASPDSLILPAMLISNVAEGTAALVVALKTKNVKLRGVASAASVSALVAGITEPAMYGVTLKYKRPLYTAMISSGIVGLFAGIFHIRAFAYANPSLISLPQFIAKVAPHNFMYAVLCAAGSVILTFILTFMFGYSDKMVGVQADQTTNQSTDNKTVTVSSNNSDVELESGSKNTKKVYAPMNGQLVSLDTVDDNVFSSKMMGDGVSIQPTNGEIDAPFDGKVVTVFPTKHAIGLKSNLGIELMIHIGLNTVELKGKPFTQCVAVGDEVKKGQLLMKVDLKAIQEAGYDTTTPIIVTNTKDFVEVEPVVNKKVTTDDVAMYVI